MKFRKKLFGVNIITIACLLSALILTAFALLIISNIVTITITDYSLALDPAGGLTVPRYTNVTFTATLTDGGSPVSGVTVRLYRELSQIGTGTTDVNGICTWTINMTEPSGSYDFHAEHDAP